MLRTTSRREWLIETRETPTKINVTNVWDKSVYQRIVLQKNRFAESVVKKDIDEVLSGKIVSNDLFLGEIIIDRAESHPWETMLTLNFEIFILN